MKINKKRIAVLDIGTNTFHILIAELEANGTFKSIHKEKIPVKLGEGGINKNIITQEAIERGKKAFSYFNDLLVAFEVKKLKTIATSAVRNASNGSDFVKMAAQEYNIIIEVIDGNREAELIYKGVKNAVPLDNDKYLIIDIGGGSVEFIICNQEQVYWKQSFEIGGQRLVEQFHQHNPIDTQEVIALEKHIKEKLLDLFTACSNYEPNCLIGASGAFETLSDIYYKEHQITGSIVDENYHILPKQAYLQMHNEIVRKTREERLAIPGMIEMRVDMIVVSSYLISLVLDHANINRITTSSFALKEGVISEF